MLARPIQHRFGMLLLVLLVAATGCTQQVPDFCFIHTSDNHLSPQPAGSPAPDLSKGPAGGLTWLCEQARQPQIIEPLHYDAGRPAFIIDTGDLTEYGVIANTYNTFEEITKSLPIPLYYSLGNHDETWTGAMSVMRKRYGDLQYSFDKFGCHFVCLNSATPQEPLPSIERRTLVWLADDLSRVPRNKPVFLFCHHQLSSTEFAKPFEQIRLLQLLDGHNVVLLLMGHGHGHYHEKWNNLDSVMGGTTSHPTQNIGYNIVWIKDGILHVAFRPKDPGKPMQLTLEKPIAPQPQTQLQLLSPKPTGLNGTPSRVIGDAVPVELKIFNAPSPAQASDSQIWPTSLTARIDDETSSSQDLASTGGNFDAKLSTANLLPGMHYVIATAQFGKQKFDTAEEFLFAPPNSPAAVRVVLDAGVKAGPVLADNGLIVATTGGKIVQLSLGDNARKPKVLFDAGVEILHSPALVDGQLYFSAAEKGVHRMGLDGKLVWKCDVGAAVYGTPAVDAQRVYVADMEGDFHAIDRNTGKLVWSKHHAAFNFEMPVLLHDGVLYAGAWDGFVYAVNAADGSLKWKQAGPAGQTGKHPYTSRYYAPADCPLIAIGDRLFVTDRAYRLGSYKLDSGEYLGQIAENVAAIGPTADGRGFYARGLTTGLTRYDGKAGVVWADKDLDMGRFPVLPLERAGKVYTCSNRGTLTVHDAAGGKLLLSYQACPQLHVMAPVAADNAGNAYVAGMDGSVTKVSPLN